MITSWSIDKWFQKQRCFPKHDIWELGLVGEEVMVQISQLQFGMAYA